MGKHVLSNNIATDVRQPYTKVTHEWYNAMITEAVEALGKGLLGTNSNFVVLYGCVNSDSPDADITAGAIWYNGEIYLCPAFVDTTITNDIVGTITTAYDAADPILFSDGNSYDVHQVKTIVWSDAASGSGDIDFSDLKFQNGTIKTVIEIGDWDMDANATKNVGWVGNIDNTKVLSVKAMIRDDANTFYYPLDSMDTATFAIQGGVSNFFTNQAGLVRLTGGNFDTTDFNATSYNRGYIIVEHFA